jgi:hypothetical protein
VSTAKNDGGPAFPRALPKGEFPLEDVARIIEQHSGMTLRDYFAAKAMAAPLASAVLPEESWPDMLPMVARFAYAMADAMLKAREA